MNNTLRFERRYTGLIPVGGSKQKEFIMMLKCWCGHYTDEGTLEFREYCKGCGSHPADKSEEAWEAFLDTFEIAEEDEY